MHWSYLTIGGSTPRCSTSVSRKPFFYPFENFGIRNVHCFTRQNTSPCMSLQPLEYIILCTFTIYQPQMVGFCYSNDRLFHPSAVCKGIQVSNFIIYSRLVFNSIFFKYQSSRYSLLKSCFFCPRRLCTITQWQIAIDNQTSGVFLLISAF